MHLAGLCGGSKDSLAVYPLGSCVACTESREIFSSTLFSMLSLLAPSQCGVNREGKVSGRLPQSLAGGKVGKDQG